MRRTVPSWRIWVVAAVGAAVIDLTLALRQLWLEPRAHDHELVWWLDLPLSLFSAVPLLLAIHLPMRAAGRFRPSPQAFFVLPGQFVAPPAPWLRVVATQVALAAWGGVPVVVLSWQIVVPGASPWPPAFFGVLAGLLATVIAWRVHHREVTLTPEGLTVREVWDTEVTLPWDRAASELVADPRSLRWVDARFLARVVDHYWAEPAHRPAIGTPEEHRRLTALLCDPAPTSPA
ncbi:hypothetical protein OHA72_29680 [Dactylosporangium sp. NBC_01737]|uniref:hypothetical protein n=1 Tax=Dactylosporangium sp. NBC_01737 TaxID=2975959 RepID=UPI002E0F4D37|nr:hypothetical protein OHA72_29680 [Dactylosporangium sp. NBC_01737]